MRLRHVPSTYCFLHFTLSHWTFVIVKVIAHYLTIAARSQQTANNTNIVRQQHNVQKRPQETNYIARMFIQSVLFIIITCFPPLHLSLQVLFVVSELILNNWPHADCVDGARKYDFVFLPLCFVLATTVHSCSFFCSKFIQCTHTVVDADVIIGHRNKFVVRYLRVALLPARCQKGCGTARAR